MARYIGPNDIDWDPGGTGGLDDPLPGGPGRRRIRLRGGGTVSNGTKISYQIDPIVYPESDRGTGTKKRVLTTGTLGGDTSDGGTTGTKRKTIKITDTKTKFTTNGLPPTVQSDKIDVIYTGDTYTVGGKTDVIYTGDVYTVGGGGTGGGGGDVVVFDDRYKWWENDVRDGGGTKYTPTTPTPKVNPREQTPGDIFPKLGDPLIPPTILDDTNKYWTWNECNKRWWTPDVIPNNQMGGGLSLTSNGAMGGTGGGTNYLPANLAWSSWDSIRGEWIRRSIKDWCTPEDRRGDPPMDDCAKYGINCPDTIAPGKVFTKIDIGDRLPLNKHLVTYGIWSGNVGNLTSFYTCSAAEVPERKSCSGQALITASAQLYNMTILNKECGGCNTEAQFNIAYGHDGGSGSKDLGGYDWATPTNAVYSQYKLLCHGGEKPWFTIGERRVKHFYAINIKKERLRDGFDPGNIELNLAHLSGSLFQDGGGARNAHTGSNVKLAGTSQILRLVDDSKLNFETDLSDAALSGSYSEVGLARARLKSSGGDVHYMVSGSLELGVYNKSNPTVYGMVFPSLGVMIIDGDMVDSNAGFLTVTGSDVAGDNNMKMFTAISGAALYTDDSGDILGFQARRNVEEYMEHMFIRVRNTDYNFSNNKTFQSGSFGEIHPDFYGNPLTYITEIGFYNDQRELLAVGKLSQPILKNYVNEGLFTVRLGYK